MDSDTWYVAWLISVALVILGLMLVFDDDSVGEDEETEEVANDG